MSRHLLLLGGGHAQLSLLEAAPRIIARGHRVTLVAPEPVHYYSGMGPGLLGGSYSAAEIRFPIRDIAQSAGVEWIRDRAVRVRADERVVELASGATVGYDVLSVTTGSSVAPTVAVDEGIAGDGPRVFTVKPIARLLELREYLEREGPRLLSSRDGALRVLVVGGGAAAVEAAANLRRLSRAVHPEDPFRIRIDLIVGRGVLPGFPRAAERAIVRALASLGVTVRAGDYVRRVTAEGAVARNGVEPADVVLLATGVVPSRLFADSHLPVGKDGSLAVNRFLHCLGYPSIFGAGDCVWYTPKPLPRAGVFAVRQAPVLRHNVEAALDGEQSRMHRFRPGGGYLLLLNLGDGSALLWRRVLGLHAVARGRWAWRLKDRIDQGFMHRYGSEADRGNEH